MGRLALLNFMLCAFDFITVLHLFFDQNFRENVTFENFCSPW